MLFSVMGHMKNLHLDWLNAQNDRIVAPGEGTHDGYRGVKAMRASDLVCASPADAVEELCGWADERRRDAQDAQDAQDAMDGNDDYASPTDEDCGWFGYEGLCED